MKLMSVTVVPNSLVSLSLNVCGKSDELLTQKILFWKIALLRKNFERSSINMTFKVRVMYIRASGAKLILNTIIFFGGKYWRNTLYIADVLHTINYRSIHLQFYSHCLTIKISTQTGYGGLPSVGSLCLWRKESGWATGPPEEQPCAYTLDWWRCWYCNPFRLFPELGQFGTSYLPPTRHRHLQNVLTVSDLLRIFKWICDEGQASPLGTKNLPSRAVKAMPNLFRGARNEKIQKAALLWKNRAKTLDEQNSNSTNADCGGCEVSHNKVIGPRRVLMKVRSGRGRKWSPEKLNCYTNGDLSLNFFGDCVSS